MFKKKIEDVLEYVAYCSQCVAPVEVEETNIYIRCKSCGHTKAKKDIKNLTGKQVIKTLMKSGKM